MPRRSKTDVLTTPGPPIPSTCTPEQLGATLAAANLHQIEDPERRVRAFMDAITGLIISTTTDPQVRNDLFAARLEAARRGR